jgi:hypothetical protein
MLAHTTSAWNEDAAPAGDLAWTAHLIFAFFYLCYSAYQQIFLSFELSYSSVLRFAIQLLTFSNGAF